MTVNHKMTFRSTPQVELGLCLMHLRNKMCLPFNLFIAPPPPSSVIVPPADFPVSQPVTSGHPDCQLKHKGKQRAAAMEASR